MATVKQNFYKWHRILGLIALVPIIFWTISGLSHPFMANWFRPYIPQEVFKPPSQRQMKPLLSLQQIMDKNRITFLRNFGVVNFNHQTCYQILSADSIYKYYSADDGTLLLNGDRNYAIWMARYFTQDTLSAVKSVKLQKKFDGLYQPINHLLPVWKVSLNRPDGMDIYIETGQNRMATFNNNTRKGLLLFFEQLHTWAFLAAIGGEQFRIIVLLILVGLMFLSLLSGLTVYGFFWKKFKTIQQSRRAANRPDTRFIHRFHRQIGLIVSFIMFTFIVSATFHLLVKLHNIGPSEKVYSQLVYREDLRISNLNLPVADSTILKVAVIKFNRNSYYQISVSNKKVLYFNTADGSLLNNGDELYAAYLSNYFKIGQRSSALSITPVRQFDNEYGFINKRLPVQKVAYANGEHWYIETTTSKLAAKIAGIDLAEGFSFIFLHKYFGMSWAGKDLRDVVSMLAALGILVASLFGFAAFLKNKSSL